MNLEIASSRKFKWLRERMVGSSPHTTLLNQIKSFVLTDEVDVNSLRSCLGRQVTSKITCTYCKVTFLCTRFIYVNYVS